MIEVAATLAAWRRLAVAAAAVVLASCAPAISPAPSLATPAPSGGLSTSRPPCGTVTIAVNPWPGSEADTAVVGYLLEHELGCAVVRRQLDEISGWQFLASGDVDVMLENWAHQDLVQWYSVDQHLVVDAGPTGNVGTVGWFVPRYVAEAHPDLLTADHDPHVLDRYATLFQTAASAPQGQVLDGDPGFVTQDRAMIAGLGLDYRVVYAGSEEAQRQAILAAISAQQPILTYHVEPDWFDTKVDLVHVPLPPHTPGCDADPNRVPCDYPTYPLDKEVSARFAASGSPAAELVSRFRWTNADQDAVAASIVDEHLSDDEAAVRWLDDHPETWRAWLP